jgi:biotin synthase
MPPGLKSEIRKMNKEGILSRLREENVEKLETLWREADNVRAAHVGDAVHLRGLIEISNVCNRRCAYCGLRADNRSIGRYRMTTEEIMLCVHDAVDYGYGTVVLQSGEDEGITGSWMSELIRRIKAETGLAVTLSLGERAGEELLAWRKAGADRYLIRFETSNRKLYELIHHRKGARPSDRLAILENLRTMGYETGSGVMIGIPGQTYEDLARDIILFRELDLDMIGVGPYLPHPETPLGKNDGDFPAAGVEQVPNTELMTYKVIALSRLACPEANIPSTTALATVNRQEGRELGLQRGANVVMPNLTPPEYRVLYEIYPGKACIHETAGACASCLNMRIISINRRTGTGPGGRRKRALTHMGQNLNVNERG